MIQKMENRNISWKKIFMLLCPVLFDSLTSATVLKDSEAENTG